MKRFFSRLDQLLWGPTDADILKYWCWTIIALAGVYILYQALREVLPK